MGGHINYPRVEEGFAVGLRGIGNKNTPWDRESRAGGAFITQFLESLTCTWSAAHISRDADWPGMAWPLFFDEIRIILYDSWVHQHITSTLDYKIVPTL
jgi:hypothetical protein